MRTYTALGKLPYLTLILNILNVRVLLKLKAPLADKGGQAAKLDWCPVPTSARNQWY